MGVRRAGNARCPKFAGCSPARHFPENGRAYRPVDVGVVAQLKPAAGRPPTAPLVLVVEDEPSYVDAMTPALERAGFSVEIARDGRQALDKFDELKPMMVLLDVMLPGLSGIDVCRRIRETSDVPLIMVTGRSEEIDAVIGLEVGADDYITKPFQMKELLARMQAVLRRNDLRPAEVPVEATLIVGDVSLDAERHEVLVRGAEVRMPPKEFELLRLLLANAGKVMARRSLVEAVWGSDYVGDTKTLDVHIKRLRSRIEESPSRPARITTIRGVGYRYEVKAGR
jgi:two-component system response regulator RegX3